MIPYLFISGFLGSGKTTLLNNLLHHYSNLRIGVIVNDFGDLAVDEALVDTSSVSGEIVELRSGQIFCSCLSGSFIKGILAYEEIAPDLILDECSGLAKPASLRDIASVISTKSNSLFSCLGMISIVDATRYSILKESLLVIQEQIEASDILLISKLEQLQEDEAREFVTDIKKEFPRKIVSLARKGQMEEDILSLLQQKNKEEKCTGSLNAYQDLDPEKYRGWEGSGGRPQSFTLQITGLSLAEIQEKLAPFQRRWYRLKGSLITNDRGTCYFDATEQSFEVKPSTEKAPTGLVVITHDADLEQELKALFSLQTDTLQPFSLPLLGVKP